ncbi:MAG TPA: hypothetical protein VM165_15665 [Planctomycetaceae bacterium]|nr:hypothetical protein [Planctomycetaceae bacterium]
MPRGIVLKAVFVAVLCGCQSSTGWRECADCVPPKTATCSYKPGCDNLVIKLTAVGCADDALKAMKKNCGKQSKDFEAGFRQSYIDQAMGRPALTPPVPARKYWNAYYRSCAGQEAVAQWFEGYRSGLDYGANSGVSRFNRVVSSWTAGSGALTDAAICAPPEMLPPGYGDSVPVPQSPPNGTMGPYGPLLNPTSYQTPQYGAPQTQTPVEPTQFAPGQRVGRMQLDVF